MGKRSMKRNSGTGLTSGLLTHIGYLEKMPHVTKVRFRCFDKIDRQNPEGVYLDTKLLSGYQGENNDIPIIINDRRAKGTVRAVVYAEPGHYQDVLAQLASYAVNGNELDPRKDPHIRGHLQALESLDEVAKVDIGTSRVTDRQYPSGIHDIVDDRAGFRCMLVGERPSLAFPLTVFPNNGCRDDLSFILENYKEYCEPRPVFD